MIKVDRIIETSDSYEKMGLHVLISSDQKRYSSVFSALTKLGFYSVFLYRLSHNFSKKNYTNIARIIQLLNHLITGAEISHQAKIGPNFAILHCSAVLIGPNVRIGKTSTICQSVSISTNRDVEERAPVIGDNFWAGPGAVIMGSIVLGNEVWVGPNSVLMKSVDSDMMVVGNPAKVIKKEVFSKILS